MKDTLTDIFINFAHLCEHNHFVFGAITVEENEVILFVNNEFLINTEEGNITLNIQCKYNYVSKAIEYSYTSFDFTKSWGDSEYRQDFVSSDYNEFKSALQINFKIDFK